MSPYATLHVEDMETGVEEEFSVRVGTDAVNDWLKDRARLRRLGRPDRPPDVDVEGLRGWVQHPGEEGHPYFARSRDMVLLDEERPPGVFPVMACSWRTDQAATRLFVQGYADGAFDVRVMVEALAKSEVSDVHIDDSLPGIHAVFEPDRPIEEVADGIEQLVMRLDAMHSGVIPWVVTPLDYDRLEQEFALARAEAERGFMALPEGRVS